MIKKLAKLRDDTRPQNIIKYYKILCPVVYGCSETPKKWKSESVTDLPTEC